MRKPASIDTRNQWSSPPASRMQLGSSFAGGGPHIDTSVAYQTSLNEADSLDTCDPLLV